MDNIRKKFIKYYVEATIAFVCFFIYLISIISYNNGWLWLQLGTITISTISIIIGINKKNIKSILIITAISQILYYTIFSLSDVTKVSSDAESYLYVSKKISDYYNLFDGFTAYFKGILNSYYYDFTDFGYISILSTLLYVFGETLGKNIDTILKLTAHLYSVYLIFIFIKKTTNRDFALLIALLFGVNSFASYIAFSFLKENYFVFSILISIVLMYKCIDNYSTKNVLYFLLSLIWTYSFRSTIPTYFIAAYFIFHFLRNKKPLYSKMVIFILIMFVFIGNSIILKISPNSADIFQNRAERFDSSTAGMFMNLSGPFLSPIPAIASTNVNSNLMIISYSFLNICLSIYAILGMYYVIDKKYSKLYPILFIFLFNCFMVILTDRKSTRLNSSH